MFGRKKKPAPLPERTAMQDQFLQLVKDIKSVYRAAPDTPVDKQKFLLLVDFFEALYVNKVTDEIGDNYLNSFISTGRIEGAVADILGTVPEAIQRQRIFIEQQAHVYPHQCAILCDALVKCLDRERFTPPFEAIISRFAQDLWKISKGEI